MIDVHCHLEQSDYDKDRDDVVERCRKELKAIITSCANPSDFEKTMEIAEKFKGFVFATCGIHPEYVKDLTQKQIDDFVELLRQNKSKMVAIGEIGLDYFWVKEPDLQEKSRDMFAQLISLAKETDLPMVVHTRDAHEDVVRILEREDARKVDLHMWGDHHSVQRIVENGWLISMNAIILRSKSHKKIARDCPLENLMLETDAPWLAPKRLLEGKEERNEPTSIRLVAEKIAEAKKADFGTAWSACGRNAVKLFGLPMEA